MKRMITIATVIAALALSACGSDGDSSSTSDTTSNPDLSASQAAAAGAAIDSAAANGVTFDETCVNQIAAQLSEEDAKAAAANADAQLSAEGEALGAELLTCANADGIVDLFIAAMAESGQPFDEDCARTKLKDVDVAELTATATQSDPPAELMTALAECFGG